MEARIFARVTPVLAAFVALSHGSGQTIQFSGVPSNATVQCASEVAVTTNAIPFGLFWAELSGKTAGDMLLIDNAGLGAGKWAKLNLADYSTPSHWLAHMTPSGCGCRVTLGAVSIILGDSHVRQAFGSIPTGSVLVMPLLDQAVAPSTIVGFVVVRMLSFAGSGTNWTADFEILGAMPPLAHVTAASSCGAVTGLQYRASFAGPDCNGTVTRTWTATDSCAHSAIATQRIAVADTTAPSIRCPGSVVIVTNTGSQAVSYVALGTPSVTDNCPGPLTVTTNAPPQFPAGTTAVTWTATDGCGNSALCSQKVVVVTDTSFRVLDVQPLGDAVRLDYIIPRSCTGIVEAATAADGNFTDAGPAAFFAGNGFQTNSFHETGAGTNFPSRFYRVRLAP